MSFPLPATQLAFWDETLHTFRTEPGPYQLLAGPSLRPPSTAPLTVLPAP
ncbi:MAG: fibronectin type III-like domain-contianing protein [Kiritimatiellia bacterium]